MVRYTYGGLIQELAVGSNAQYGNSLVAQPNSVMPALYNKPKSDNTRVVVTDFQIDPEYDGTFVNSASIPTDAKGYPVPFKGPDGVKPLYDVDGHAWFPQDAEAGSVPSATTTAAGVGRMATTAEHTGTAPTGAVFATPAGVQARITAHEQAADPHPAYGDAIDVLAGRLATVPTLNVEGKMPTDQLPVSQSPLGAAVVQYRTDGSIGVTGSIEPDSAMPRSAVETLVAGSLVAGGDVRALSYTNATGLAGPLSANGTLTKIPTVVVTDAETAWWVEYVYDIYYRATAAGGIQVRHVGAAAAPTNLETNPRAEVDLTGWYSSGNSTLTRTTTAGAPDGTNNTAFLLTANAGVLAGSTTTAWSAWKPATPGNVASLRVQMRRTSATQRNGRADIQFGDATAVDDGQSLGVIVPATNGPVVAVNTTAYQPSTLENITVPTGAVKVRTRVVMQNVAAAEALAFGAVQLEPSATLPAYGSTGGSGSGSILYTGRWGPGLTLTAAGSENYARLTSYRGATSTLTQHGGLGSTTDAHLFGTGRALVGGTGLTSQRIELEFGPRADVTAGNETRVYAVSATFARIA